MRLLHKDKTNKTVTNLISYGLLLVILAITLVSMAASKGQNIYLEIASSFKIQYLVIIIGFSVFLAILRTKYFFLISLACITINLAEIVPWYITQPGLASENPANLRVLLFNVNSQKPNYSKVISLIRQEKPDIAVFLHLNEDWIKQLKSINDILPNQVARPDSSNFDIAIYSKNFLENLSSNFVIPRNNPSVVGDLIINKQFISVLATHPIPPTNEDFFQVRNQQLNEISQYIKQQKKRVIVIGNLNTTMWSPYYKKFVQKTGLRNTRQGFGILPTWPTKASYSKVPHILSVLLSIPIDHCLVSPGIKVVNIRTGPNIGSEHLPLITDLFIPGR